MAKKKKAARKAKPTQPRRRSPAKKKQNPAPAKKSAATTANAYIKKASAKLEQQLGDTYVKQFKAKKKRLKTKHGKKISALKQQLNRLSK